LIVSGILTSLGVVVALSIGPFPVAMSNGLADLDERTNYPVLPAPATMSGADASTQLKSLVAVISPAAQTWFGKREVLSMSFGAGALLQATPAGYLFATARHVIGTADWSVASKPRAMIFLESGVWSGADVIARHQDLDLALVWIPRHSGSTSFSPLNGLAAKWAAEHVSLLPVDARNVAPPGESPAASSSGDTSSEVPAMPTVGESAAAPEPRGAAADPWEKPIVIEQAPTE